MALPELPHLTVVSEGPYSGQSYAVQLGSQLVGRSADADLVIASPNLSRRHAYLSWDGTQLEVEDAGSTNGTTVNGERITGARLLHSGEILELGDLVLRVDAPVSDATVQLAAVAPSPPSFSASVRTNEGQINQAGRDVNVKSWTEAHYEQQNPMEEIFRGRGAGRFLLVLGIIIAICGFAVWMSLIFSVVNSTNGPGDNPFGKQVAGVPEAALGFGAFALGGLMAGIGATMSKVAREREREAEFRSGRW